MSELVDTESDRGKVESWRLHVLIEGGYPLHLAERLAATEIDLHRAVGLLDQGCDPATAAEILL
jgi:hypothetical protein